MKRIDNFERYLVYKNIDIYRPENYLYLTCEDWLE